MRLQNRPTLLIASSFVVAVAASATTLHAQGPLVASLNVLRVKIQQNTRSIDKPNDVIVVKGDFRTEPAVGDTFDVASGVSVQVTDALTVDETFAFDPADCVTSTAGKTKCFSATRPWSVTFSQAGKNNPTAYKFKAHFKGFIVTAPFLAPVTITVAQGAGTIRTGDVAECAARPRRFLCQQL